jgi:hypothetical protein
MRNRIIVTLGVDVDSDLDGVDNIVENLSFLVTEKSENVEVCSTDVIEFFESND